MNGSFKALTYSAICIALVFILIFMTTGDEDE